VSKSDEDFLATAAVVARARVEVIGDVARRLRGESARHESEVVRIRGTHLDANRALVGVLDEAARRRIPQHVLSQRLGLSRQRLYKIRQAMRA
jgi:hypothetical protein